jgi:hypothetical protein
MHDAIMRTARSLLSGSDSDDGDAVTEGDAGRVFRPEECLSFAEALWLYTVGAAYAGSCEQVLGQVCGRGGWGACGVLLCCFTEYASE